MARVSLHWYNEIVRCRRLPLAAVNLTSTKDGERVLNQPQRQKHGESPGECDR